ncbi:hypothetical protein B0H21DRAFT_727167 [Amylocystis lapponica]|nr:hypothetical protein B0H21DRAFT_727167 [Amylocystis lapponica]
MQTPLFRYGHSCREDRSKMNFTTRAIFVPSELNERILDFLWDSPAALKASSLTCRLWFQTSHYQLFRSNSVKLRCYDHWKLFETLLRDSAEVSTGLTNYISNLEIVVFYNADESGKRGESTWLTLVEPGTRLHQILADLSAVRRLTIDGYHYSLAEPEVRHQFTQFLCNSAFIRSLTTLQLWSIVFETHDHLVRILSACPSLSSLDLKDCYVERGPPPPVLLPPTPDVSSGGMRRIRLDGDLGIIVRLQRPQSLWSSPSWNVPLWLLQGTIYELCPRRLTWEGCAVIMEQPLLQDLLRRTASSLEHVDLTLSLGDDMRIHDELVDLSPCTKLISAHIEVNPDEHMAPAWVRVILKQIFSTRMRELHIAINLRLNDFRTVVSRGWYWESIDRDLCRLGELNPWMTVYFDCAVDLERGPENGLTDIVADLEGRLPLARNTSMHIAATVKVRSRSGVAAYRRGEHWLKFLAGEDADR